MIREIVGSRTIASVFMPKKKRRSKMIMPSMSTLGIMAGAGIAYMAMRNRNGKADENTNE